MSEYLLSPREIIDHILDCRPCTLQLRKSFYLFVKDHPVGICCCPLCSEAIKVFTNHLVRFHADELLEWSCDLSRNN